MIFPFVTLRAEHLFNDDKFNQLSWFSEQFLGIIQGDWLNYGRGGIFYVFRENRAKPDSMPSTPTPQHNEVHFTRQIYDLPWSTSGSILFSQSSLLIARLNPGFLGCFERKVMDSYIFGSAVLTLPEINSYLIKLLLT